MQNLAFSRNRGEREDVALVASTLPMQPRNLTALPEIICRSEKMQEVYSMIEKVADSDSTVLIFGESGTGKELITRAIHENSYRRNKPFIPINCGAIPEHLLESELFGHVQGAFTGATAAKPGKFELADGGTIFLDEIGDMSAALQVKLLRVTEEREFARVGGTKTIKVDVRIVAATHRDLEEAVQKGTFREDLYYRLNVIPITLPSLRERREDIPFLVLNFLTKFNREKKKMVQGISDEAIEIMQSYQWPGNVREMRNVLENLVVLKGSGEISAKDLPLKMQRKKVNNSFPHIEISDQGICLNTAVSEFEKALIIQSLEKTQWIKNKAAKLLHMNRTTLVEKIKKHGLLNEELGQA